MSGNHNDHGPPLKRFKKEEDDDDNLWGDELDENTLEECFFLASQVLSQNEPSQSSTSKTQVEPSKQEPGPLLQEPGPSIQEPGPLKQERGPLKSSPEIFKKPTAPISFRPKQPSSITSSSTFTKKTPSSLSQSVKFTRKVPATSSQSQTFPKQTHGTPTQLHVYPKKSPTASTSRPASPVTKTATPKSMQTPPQKTSTSLHHLSTDTGYRMCSEIFPTDEDSEEIIQPKCTRAFMDTSMIMSPSTSTLESKTTENLMREVEDLKSDNKRLRNVLLSKDGEVAILRSHLGMLKLERDMLKISKVQELDKQAVQFHDRVKRLEKELEQKETLLEFKSLEAGNAEERCRLFESQSKLKFVEPQAPHVAGNFPDNPLPSVSTTKKPKEERKTGETKSEEKNAGEAKAGKKKTEEMKSGETKAGKKKREEKKTGETKSEETKAGEKKTEEKTDKKKYFLPDHDFFTRKFIDSDAYKLSLEISPYIFEVTMYKADREDIPNVPYLYSQIHGGTLTPHGPSVKTFYRHLSKLLKIIDFSNYQADIIIEDIVWEAFVIIRKQLEWLMCHRKRLRDEHILQLDYDICGEASKVYNGRRSFLGSKKWYSSEQSVEVRRALGLLSILVDKSPYIAKYLAGEITKKVYFPIVIPARELKKDRIRKEWLRKKNQPPKISRKQRRKMEEEERQRELEKKEKQENEEREKRLHEKAMEDELEALGLTREDWVGVDLDEDRKKCITPRDYLRNYVIGCRQNDLLSHFGPPVYLGRGSPVKKAVRKRVYCDDSTEDVGRPSKEISPPASPPPVSLPDSPPVPLHASPLSPVSPHPFPPASPPPASPPPASPPAPPPASPPVPPPAPPSEKVEEKLPPLGKIYLMHPMKWKLKTVKDRQIELGYKFEKREIQWTPFKKTLDKWAKQLLPSPREKIRRWRARIEKARKVVPPKIRTRRAEHPILRMRRKHPEKIAERLRKISEMSKIPAAERPPKEKIHNPLVYDSGRKYDFLDYLYQMLEIICEWRFTLTCNGFLYTMVLLIKKIVARTQITEDRYPVLIKLIKDLILCRPSINVLTQLVDLLGWLAQMKPIQESLCTGNGPSPHLILGAEDLVYFDKGVPRYDTGPYDEDCFYNRSSCTMTMLAWLISVKRADTFHRANLGIYTVSWMRSSWKRCKPNGPNWIGSTKDKELRECQCRPRVIEALIILMQECFIHLEETRFIGYH